MTSPILHITKLEGIASEHIQIIFPSCTHKISVPTSDQCTHIRSVQEVATVLDNGIKIPHLSIHQVFPESLHLNYVVRKMILILNSKKAMKYVKKLLKSSAN